MLRIKIGYLMVDKKIKSVAELSRQTNIHRDTLKKLVDDKKPETVSLEILLKLCKFFNCSLNDLIEFTPDDSEN